MRTRLLNYFYSVLFSFSRPLVRNVDDIFIMDIKAKVFLLFLMMILSLVVLTQEVDNVKRLQEEMRRTILDANNQIASVTNLASLLYYSNKSSS